jgi:hypothetical protein
MQKQPLVHWGWGHRAHRAWRVQQGMTHGRAMATCVKRRHFRRQEHTAARSESMLAKVRKTKTPGQPLVWGTVLGVSSGWMFMSDPT